MSFIVTFIAAVFVFSAVIAIHEFGHFMVAKLCGVQVNEFSIGMGPVLCKRVRKGTSTASAPCLWAALWRWKGRKAPRASRRRNGQTPQPPMAAAPLIGEPLA